MHDKNDSLTKEFGKWNCNSNGFRSCSHLSAPERMKAYLGLFIICNGRSVHLMKKIANSRTNNIMNVLKALVEVWEVDLEIKNGVIVLNSLGDFLNDNPIEAVKYAFPSGKIRYRETLYQLF